jgi:hypothetical protein
VVSCLAFWAFGGRVHAIPWPALSCDPIPPEAVPEMASDSLRTVCDSTRQALHRAILQPELPSAPGEVAPRLVAWLVHTLSFPLTGEVEAFGEKCDPAAWSAADPSGDLALAAALALLEAGRTDQALAWLDRGSSGEATLPYRDLLRIEARDAIGDSAGAVAVAEEVRSRFSHDDWTLPAARRLLADRERQANPDLLIRESLRTRRDLGRGADETAARFRALRAASRFAAARAVGDTLLRAYPGARTSREEALRRFRESPRESGQRQGRVLFDVFLRHRLFAQAESLLVFIPHADSLRVVQLEGLYQARRYDDVLSMTLAPRKGWPTPLRARFLLVRARAARNKGDWSRMEGFYGRAAVLGSETRRTALTEWGREAESECRESTADSIYTLLLALPGSEDEGRFRRAISRFARGEFAAALTDLEKIGPGEIESAAAFWRFRAATELGDSSRADAALREAAKGSGYYARRARLQREARAGGHSGGDFWVGEREKAFRADGGQRPRDSLSCPSGTEGVRSRAMRIRLLRRFGRTDWSARERGLLEEEIPVAGREERLLCLGLPDLAIRVAIARGAASPVVRYPRPYPEWLVDRAREAGISADFVWALARRESLFDPGVVSGAGARGVLQLVESTARETSERWGLPAGPLERADRNLAIGIAHLRDLKDRYGWHLPGMLAAYNAGAAKTEEWIRLFADPDLFIERIGWRETRDYVRHVLDGYWTYRASYPAVDGEGGGP